MSDDATQHEQQNRPPREDTSTHQLVEKSDVRPPKGWDSVFTVKKSEDPDTVHHRNQKDREQ